jgi:serine/threonine protein kinase
MEKPVPAPLSPLSPLSSSGASENANRTPPPSPDRVDRERSSPDRGDAAASRHADSNASKNSLLAAVTTTTTTAEDPPTHGWTPLTRTKKRRQQRVKLYSTSSQQTYQLGEKIGKGGSGEVHQALNLETGEVVAVKTMKQNTDVKQSEVDALQTEVELLKKLVHPNIVKYIDSIRINDELHIVLEYMENGSLRSLCDKFDGFSESLVAIYVTQVLNGLVFLHSQGVLHRDVKGANILTTKDGSVKLADFGVAMTISDDASSSNQVDTVVGSPYWMAPEIIEMQGPTAACDIWSLGCTIIELLTGKPPYMELDPMAALFRIVQDDHPPLPQGTSEALQNFLLQCFEKNPTSRSKATELIEHQWLRNPQSHIKRTEYLLRESEAAEGAGWDSIAQTLHLYARGSNLESNLEDTGDMHLRESFTGRSASANHHHHHHHHQQSNTEENSKGIAVGALKILRSLSRGMLGSLPGASYSESEKPGTEKGSPPPPKMHASPSNPDLDQPALVSNEEFFLATEQELYENSSSEGPRRSSFEVGASSVDEFVNGESVPRADDHAAPDEGHDNDEKRTKSPVDQVHKQHDQEHDHHQLQYEPQEQTQKQQHSEQVDPPEPPALVNSFSNSPEQPAAAVNVPFPPLNNTSPGSPFQMPPPIALARVRSRSRNRSFNSDNLSSENGGFGGSESGMSVIGVAGIPEDEELVTSSPSFMSAESLQKEQLIQRTKLSDEILSLLSSLQPGCDESTIVRTCNKMLKIFNDDPELPHHFVMNHGVIPVMELLEVSKLMAESIMGSILSVRSAKVLPAVLQVVNKIIENNQRVQEHLSLVGMIPVMVKIAEGIYGSINFRGSVYRQHSLHLEAAKFVEQICKSSQLTLQMFIAGGGLPLLVRHLQVASSDLRKNSDIQKIVGIGIDGILEVFKLQTIRRDDFCHLFVKLGLLPHLVVGFRSFLSMILEAKEKSEAEESWANLAKLGEIMIFFAQSDPFVKERMAVENVCLGILNPFISLSLTKRLNDKESFQNFSNLVVVLLKCLRELAAEPKTLKKLDREQAVVMLMPLLEQQQPGYDNAVFDESMECMFYLCRIDKTRQELAARHGLIQQLQRVCMGEDKLHLKEWSFPLICDMAYTSSVTREELWRVDGVLCYLNIMKYPQWRISALNAITVWLANDMERVEPVLTLPNNVEILIKCCVESLKEKKNDGKERSWGGGDFDQICQALLRLSIKSPMLSLRFGRDTIFISHLVGRLENDVDCSPVSKMCLLKLLGKVIVNRSTWSEHSIFPLLSKLARDETQILISELSSSLMKRIAITYTHLSPLKSKRGM